MKIGYPYERWPIRSLYFPVALAAVLSAGVLTEYPYETFRSGGATSLLIQAICLLGYVMPILWIESDLGHRFCGPMALFGKTPIFTGIGFAMVSFSAMFAVYLSATAAGHAWYLYQSVWDAHAVFTCNATWTTGNCMETFPFFGDNQSSAPEEAFASGFGSAYDPGHNASMSLHDSIGHLMPHYGSCMFVVWLAVVLILLMGPISYSIAVTVILIVAVALWLCFAVRVGMLDLNGAKWGREDAFREEWNHLEKHQSWVDIFWNFSKHFHLGTGVIITLNAFNLKGTRVRAFTEVPLLVLFYLLFGASSTAILYSLYGFAARELNITLETLTRAINPVQADFLTTPGLFSLAATANSISHLPIIYYTMQTLFSVTTLCAYVEVVNTGVVEIIKGWRPMYNMLLYRPIISVLSGCVLCSVSLVLCTSRTYGITQFLSSCIHLAIPILILFEVIYFALVKVRKVWKATHHSSLYKLLKLCLIMFVTLVLLTITVLILVHNIMQECNTPAYPRMHPLNWIIPFLPLMLAVLATFTTILSLCIVSPKTAAKALITPKHDSRYSQWGDASKYYDFNALADKDYEYDYD